MVLLVWLLSAVAAQGQKPIIAKLPTLTHVEQIRRMSIEEAGRGYPVRLRAVVTYYNWDAGDLFIQDSTAGTWVNPGQTKLALHQGEFVEVEGLSGAGDLAPEIDHAHFRSLGEAPMPNPQRPTSDELASGRLDSQWIELQGVVRSVVERDGGLVLNLSSGAFECPVFVLNYPSFPTDIVDAQVGVRGVFAGLYDPSSVRVIGFQVLTPSWSDVEVLEKPAQAFWSASLRPIRLLLRVTPEGAFTHRVRARGVVTLQQTGRFLCIRDREGALLANTTQPTPLKVGDVIDAVGYPAIGDYTVIMRDAIFRRVGGGPTPEPVVVSPEELRAGNHNADLVRLSARLLNCTGRPGEAVLELQAGQVTFRAVLNTGTNSSPLGSLRAGSLLRLTGVSIIEADENHEAKGFEILLRSPADIVVLELPTWWTARRIAWLLVILAGIVIWISLWVAVLRKRVEERTETIRATLESTADGILVVSSAHKIVAHNRKFAEMWRIPESVLASRDDNAALNFVLSQLRDPHTFLTRIRQTYADHDAQTDDVIEFKDARVFERHSEPQRVKGKNVGRVWGFRDVTERKQAEEALRESEVRYRGLFENSLEGIGLSLRNQVINANRALLDIFGYRDLEEFKAIPLLEHVAPQSRGLIKQMLEKLDRGDPKLKRFEYQITRKDGQMRTLEISADGIYLGGERYTQSTFRDITERKRAEEALRESETRFRAVFENAAIGIALVDMHGHLLESNPALQKMLGYSAPELAQMAFTEFTHPDDAPASRDLYASFYQGQRNRYQLDRRYRRKDGQIVWGQLTESLVRNQNGEPQYAIAMVEDISERKRAEKALRESEERHRSFIENLPVGVYRTTPDGRVLMANSAMLRMLGYDTSQELASQNLERDGFEGGYPRSAFREQIERQGEVRGLEAGWRRRDGSVVLTRESARSIRAEDGRVLYYDGTIEDITERRRLEEQLRQAQKMEAVGRLAAGVAHDFNNLLTIVIGYSDLVLQRLSTGNRMRPPLEEIKRAGERAGWLTRQLLAFSRKQVLQPQILDLNGLLTNVDQMLRRVIGEDVELVMHLPPGLGRVKADPVQIEQVIMNLAVNARDAMPQGGKLTLEAANVELDSGYASSHQSVLPGHYVMFAVSDTGVGMDAQTQAHLFEPFFTTKEPSKGTGLGLSTVYGIVKQSGGYIWVYSEPGKGATFKVYLPRIDQAVEAKVLGEPGAGELSRASETVLLVEDEKAVRCLARQVLESRGYHVLETAAGIEALEVGERHKERIHLLLTDVVMPQMGGRELAERLALLHPETKVLFMSGYADNAVVHFGLLDPGTALLEKPFTAQALARKLREVLDDAGDHKAGVMTCPPAAGASSGPPPGRE
jgi:PAS domain S-box-containing protein